MTQMRARLFAVRQATTAIHPALTQFYDALDEGQKVRFWRDALMRFFDGVD
jgi:hypothetical protein